MVTSTGYAGRGRLPALAVDTAIITTTSIFHENPYTAHEVEFQKLNFRATHFIGC